jgi:hypothetical protein
MAGVAVQYLGAGYLPAGATHHWWWNNAATKRVWSFSVDVNPTKWLPLFAPATLKVEVTRVEYRLRFESVNSQEREVHCWVKNTGDLDAIYELRMAVAPGGGSTLVGMSARPYWTGQAGAVNTSYSFVNPEPINPPRNLVAFPVLQDITETEDQAETLAFISEFVDGGTTKTGPFASIAGKAVSQIVWAHAGENSASNPLRVILFFE